MIPNELIQNLVLQADIVEVIGERVPLKQSSANWLGLCPFHQEKTPSFTVSPSKQFYHCFGCGAHGNVISFVMQQQGLGFVEAIQALAQRYGLPIPQQKGNNEQELESKSLRQRLHDVLDQACTFYQTQLKQSLTAQAYLQSRGLSQAVIKQFELGFAPPSSQALRDLFPNYDAEVLQLAGIVVNNPEHRGGELYDRFRQRVMFPIRNVHGNIAGFGGRVIGEGEPKYLNSPESEVFKKSNELFGLYLAKKAIRSKKSVIVVEGYMDVIALAEFQVNNVVATLGTACSSTHIQTLFKHCPQIVFCFDGDLAGQRAAQRALEIALPFCNEARSVKFMFLPLEHDPDSFIRSQGSDVFYAEVERSLTLSRYLTQLLGLDRELESEQKAEVMSKAARLLTLMQSSPLKLTLAQHFANLLSISYQELLSLQQSPTKLPKKSSQDFVLMKRKAPTTSALRVIALLMHAPVHWEHFSELQRTVLRHHSTLTTELCNWVDKNLAESHSLNSALLWQQRETLSQAALAFFEAAMRDETAHSGDGQQIETQIELYLINAEMDYLRLQQKQFNSTDLNESRKQEYRNITHRLTELQDKLQRYTDASFDH